MSPNGSFGAVIVALLVLHAATIAAVTVGGSRLSFRLIWTLVSVAPVVTTTWAITKLGDGTPTTLAFEWVPELDLLVAFRVDALSALLTVVVAGIGALVFGYSAGYFSSASADVARFAATLAAFATSMIGLVWADSVWTLFVFWELTSITSFLLVGHKHGDETARLAARRAFLITAAGGLVLLAGLLLVADSTTRLRELSPMSGSSAVLAGVLVLVAAATKSAQVPFHVWLPGAMSAPTPVSAYLHSATMVKAGVIVVAFLAPALGETAAWTPLGLGLGLASMLWGAIGALRHRDAKLILAWGTVSQLGLMIALLSVGSSKATFAALSILVAHAIFKAALFMVVGEIDVRTGTRDIRELGGLARSMPIACAVAVVSGASMAGIPPTLGFAAKEAGVEAALGLDGAERTVLLVGVIVGSVLTVAYTTRFVMAVFGPAAAGRAPTPVAPARLPMVIVTGLLGTATLLGFVFLGDVTTVVRDAAVLLDPGTEVYSLLRWPGLTTALMISVGIVVAGVLLGVVVLRRVDRVPRPLGADAADALVAGVLDGARRLAARVQHGSLPIYLVTSVLVSAAAAAPFVVEVDADALIWWDRAAQPALALLVAVGALGVIRIPGRLGAALGLGSVGFGVAGLFVVHGAPDLALTQLLVETVVVVGFVIGLGHLRREFPAVSSSWRNVRIVASVSLGAAVAIGLAASASAPSGAPPLDELEVQAVDTGGGNNVVNVILTDIRALDTLGEIVVLVVVALGVITLSGAGRRDEHVPAASEGTARDERVEVGS